MFVFSLDIVHVMKSRVDARDLLHQEKGLLGSSSRGAEACYESRIPSSTRPNVNGKKGSVFFGWAHRWTQNKFLFSWTCTPLFTFSLHTKKHRTTILLYFPYNSNLMYIYRENKGRNKAERKFIQSLLLVSSWDFRKSLKYDNRLNPVTEATQVLSVSFRILRSFLSSNFQVWVEAASKSQQKIANQEDSVISLRPHVPTPNTCPNTPIIMTSKAILDGSSAWESRISLRTVKICMQSSVLLGI